MHNVHFEAKFCWYFHFKVKTNLILLAFCNATTYFPFISRFRTACWKFVLKALLVFDLEGHPSSTFCPFLWKVVPIQSKYTWFCPSGVERLWRPPGSYHRRRRSVRSELQRGRGRWPGAEHSLKQHCCTICATGTQDNTHNFVSNTIFLSCFFTKGTIIKKCPLLCRRVIRTISR